MGGIVGSSVGVIADVPAGGSGSQSAGRGFDVAIGDLMFNIYASDKNAYQRATAQFRKDQLDATPTPGDQSLTGWWTRGQMSFHHGAGVDYYEVSAGETVLDRYQSGTGINPFTPGKVTLCPDWTSGTPDTHANNTYVGKTGSNLVVLDSGTVYYGAVGAAGAKFTPAGDTATDVAVGNGDIYVAGGTKITRVGLAEQVVVAYPEQGFETGIDSWESNTVLGVYNLATLSTTTAKAFEGTHSLLVSWPNKGTSNGSWIGRFVSGLVVGQSYTFVAKVWVPSGTDIHPEVPFAASGPGVGTHDAWTTVAFTFTANNSSHYVGFANLDPVSGTSLYVDKAVLYRGTRTGYDDGSVPIDVLYSHSESIAGLFYAKDRLFMVDAKNVWYQLSPDPTAALPVTVSSSDKVFTVGGADPWCLTDTPGPVLIARGNRIFAVTTDSSGAIPTLSGPVQVADLPGQEAIRALSYHLGFVTIVTSKGVRIGVVADSGGVTYGPALVEWTSTPTFTSIGRQGSCTVVTGGHAIYQIDLSEQIGNGLEFAYTELPNPFNGSEINYGAAVSPTGAVIAWADTAVRVQHATNLTATGTLTTGYHRFATLEPKRFDSVTLRAQGTGGTITISKVDQNGAVSSLYTLDLAAAKSVTVGLGMDAPTEAVALRFTLKRSGTDATAGPTLLGYQLRALPQPQRQRIIRIPLLLFDDERRQPTRPSGHKGSAWERLSALEDLEVSGTAVLYKDFRTGESANAYIESVEFTNTTPPSAKSTGFGGICYLTIRKL